MKKLITTALLLLPLVASAQDRLVVQGVGELEDLRAHSKEKHFHYALIPTKRTRRYCYATLALNHYRKISRRKLS